MGTEHPGSSRGGATGAAVTLRQLEYFVRAANAGSIHRAAKTLAVAQSAMSRQLRLLELEVGAALLLRTHSGVELTPRGRRFLSYSSAILDLLAQSRAELAREGASDRTMA